MKRTISFTLALTLALATTLVAVMPAVATEVRDAGCTPGYWKQSHHFGNWVGYSPSDRFDAVVAQDPGGTSYMFADAFGDMTLLQVLSQGGGGLKALGRHLVAALLNAAYFGEEQYMLYNVALWQGDTETSDWEVMVRFNQVYPGRRADYNAFKRQLERANETGCPLSRAELVSAPG